MSHFYTDNLFTVTVKKDAEQKGDKTEGKKKPEINSGFYS